jgi:molybdate transport system substrate-binding protein
MSVTSFRRSLLIAFLSTFLAWPILGSAVHAAEVTVFAAASLKNALDNVAKAYEAKTGDKVIISFAASSALAKQIEGGATSRQTSTGWTTLRKRTSWTARLDGRFLGIPSCL